MTAAATDLFQEVGIATATTLDAPGYTTGATSITVASTANMPTATGITFAMDEIDANGDQVAGSYNEYVGTVATATSITNVSHENGTDRNFSAGTTSRVYIPVSAERENRLVQGILVEHLQTGVHALTSSSTLTSSKYITAMNDTNGNELFKLTATASAVNEFTVANAATGAGPTISATGGDTNIDINIAPKGTGVVKVGGNTIQHGAWTSFTPTLANMSVGNGTASGKWSIVGKTVNFRWTFTLGSTSTVGTAPTITLPVTAAESAGYIGVVNVLDNAAATSPISGQLTLTSTTVGGLYYFNTNAIGQQITATAPFAFGTGDYIEVRGTYEAA